MATAIAADHSFYTRWGSLARQERKVAELTVVGFRAIEVAEITGRSRKTIEVQRMSVLRKMECETSINLTKAYWCQRTKEELQEQMQPVVLRRKTGSSFRYYLGYYLPEGIPATSENEQEGAVFAGKEVADLVSRQLNSRELVPWIWEVVPRQQAIIRPAEKVAEKKESFEGIE